MKELTIREQQLGVLDILKDVHCFCVKNGIRYSLAYGTLIGAVRHRGFIPWDNDIDIVMLRQDYDLFINRYESSEYKVASHIVGKNDCLIAYARVYDPARTIASGANWASFETGLWIDVFPLDNVPSDQSLFKVFYNSLIDGWHWVNRMRCRYEHLSTVPKSERGRLAAKKVLLLNGAFGSNALDRFMSSIKKYNNLETGFVSQLTVLDNGPVEHLPCSR